MPRYPSRSRSLQFETLETRAIPAAGLDLVYHSVGQFNRSREVVRTTLPIPTTDFTLPTSGRVYLGFAFEPTHGSTLDPAAFIIKGTNGAAVSAVRRVANVPGEKSALYLGNVKPGGVLNFTLRPTGKTTGAFELSTYLVGDVDGDGRVNANDTATIQALNGVKRDAPLYRLEADVNRDGLINKTDLTYANRNLSVEVNIPRSERRLREGTGLLSETIVPTALGSGTGSRVLRVPVTPHFDTTDSGAATPDTFLVYLVDPNNPSRTLIDRGTPGTALFSLVGTNAEMVPGRVRFDGTTLEIDVSGLPETQGNLVFQIVNTDNDTGGTVRAGPATLVSAAGTVRPTFPVTSDLAPVGTAFDTATLSSTTDVALQLQNIRVNSSGTTTAELVLRNNGSALGRQAVVVFPSLPTGVTLTNASGVDTQGNPYVSFHEVLPSGGFQSGQQSRPIEVSFSNPALVPLRLVPIVKVGGSNQAPTLNAIGPLTVTVGQILSVPITSSDPDGDPVSLTLAGVLPTGTLNAATLRFTPQPSDLGSYSFDLIASDGALETHRTVTLDVVADAESTSRLSGMVQDSSGNPLSGLVVEWNGTTDTTAVDGSFRLTFAGAFPTGSVVVHGEQLAGPTQYPKVTISPTTLLGHVAIAGSNNSIVTPISLTAVDTTNAGTVNPGVDSTITTPTLPGTSLLITAGSTGYPGLLALQAIDLDHLPVELPRDVHPDTVLSIEPSGTIASVTFTTPATLTVPNPVGWATGRLLDLWVLNPATGLFTDSGDAVVLANGSIQTTTGGVTTNGVYFTAPKPEVTLEPGAIVFNEDTSGVEETKTMPLTSEVELHSGAVLETHDLVTYQSVGQARGLSLRYDSLRADPRPIIHFTLPDVDPIALAGDNATNLRLVAKLTLTIGNFTYEMPGADAQLGLSAGYHFWKIPAAGGRIEAALQPSLRKFPTGRYEYEVTVGVVLLDSAGAHAVGTTQTVVGTLNHVNSIGSPLGHGWSFAGVQQVVENADSSVLIVDGDGSEIRFAAPPTLGTPYVSPRGDFTTLEKVDEGNGLIFRRTTQDHTISRFNAHNRLASVIDRNGNLTTYGYDGQRLISVTDPANLVTTLTYGTDFVDILDPANRTTHLTLAGGELVQITDPDNSTRTFGYDGAHLLTTETDKRGFSEETSYGFHGRAVQGVRGDGSEIFVDPVQVHGLFRPDKTTNPNSAPFATSLSTLGQASDASGGVTGVELDQQGQAVSEADALGTTLDNVVRDSTNRVTQFRLFGNLYEIVYDADGNPIALRDGESAVNGGFDIEYGFSTNPYNSGDVMAVADFTRDGMIDVAVAADDSIAILANDGTGLFSVVNTIYSGSAILPRPVVGDVNNDGDPDLLIEEYGYIRVLLGQGNAQFVEQVSLFASGYRTKVLVRDLNADNRADVVVLPYGDPLLTFLSNGDGTFADPIAGVMIDSPLYVALDDLNGDTQPDLVYSEQTLDGTSLKVALGNGDGSFATPAEELTYTKALVVADFNGDHRPDIATHDVSQGSSYGPIVVLLNAGNGTFGPPMAVFTPTYPSTKALRAGDVTGDGITDLIVVKGPFQTQILRGNGLGGFVPLAPLLNSGAPDSGPNFDDLALADVDGDGDLDFLAATDPNGLSRALSVRFNDGAGGPAPGPGKTAVYDPIFHQLLETLGETGRRTVYEIDPANGNRLKETRVVGALGDSDDVIKEFTYTSQGLLASAYDACGCSGFMINSYDVFGRLTKTTYGLGTTDESFRRFEYDLAGNLSAVIDENGKRTEYLYDTMNRLVRVTQPDPDGAGPLQAPVTEYGYDAAGNRTNTTDPLGHVWLEEFDPRNRVITRTTPDSDASGPLGAAVSHFTYDDSGNLLSEIDPLGRVTQHQYDARQRRIQTTDPAGGIVKYEYDAAGNRLALVDPQGNRSTFEYDRRNRLVKETDPLGKSITHSYNAADERIETIDRNGRRTRYDYDELGQLTREIWFNPANIIQSTYDHRGNRLTLFDNFSHLTFTYDARNRVKTVDNSGTPNAPQVLLNYTYDGVDNVLSVTEAIDGQPGAVTAYTYDPLNRLAQLTQSGPNVAEKRVDFEYNVLGQPVELERFADLAGAKPVIQSEYFYDDMSRLISLTYLRGTTKVASYVQTYDVASAITMQVSRDGTARYTYDVTGQVLTASRTSSNTYDANGNRTTGGYTTGPGNRLLSTSRFTYTYDNEGNLLKQTDKSTKQTREFVWDQRNWLIQVTDKNSQGTTTQIVQYKYDAMDRRIAKSIDTEPTDTIPAVVTHFVYDREDVLLEFVDVDGTGGNAPALSLRYLHGADIDQVLAQENVNESLTSPYRVLWLLPDHLGSTRDVVDNTGIVRNHIIYDAFGRIISQSNAKYSTRYLFTGREYDAETGLYYYRSRYYNPLTGRFLSEDRIRFEAGDANLYRYVGNNPVSRTDPRGKRQVEGWELWAVLLTFFSGKFRQEACVDYYENSPEGQEYVKNKYGHYDKDSLEANECRFSAEVEWFLLAGLALVAYARWQQDRKRRRELPKGKVDELNPFEPQLAVE